MERKQVNKNLAQMLKGGVIMDVTNKEQAIIAEKAGACAVMALERVPSDIRKEGGVARMSDPKMIKEIQEAVSIPVMAKVRIGHFVEAQILQALNIDFIDESEVLTPADDKYHIAKDEFEVPFVCGATNIGEALRRIGEGASMIRTKGEAGTGDVVNAGGESTTMGKLLDVTGLKEPLKEKIKSGIPTWGTCAGMILLAKEIENDTRRHLSLMDIKVRRNAFGTQIDSFKTKKVIKEVSQNPLELVFIRAPFITEVKDNVKVLCEVNDNIVAVRQDNMIATSFHPELTDDLTFLKYFLKI